MNACIVPIEIIELIAQGCDLMTLHALMRACIAINVMLKAAISRAPVGEWTPPLKHIDNTITYDYIQRGGDMYGEHIPVSYYVNAWRENIGDFRRVFRARYGWSDNPNSLSNIFYVSIIYGVSRITRLKCQLCGKHKHCIWLYDYVAATRAITASVACAMCVNNDGIYMTCRNRLSRTYRTYKNITEFAYSPFNDAIQIFEHIGLITNANAAYAKMLSFTANIAIDYKRPTIW